MNFDDILRSTGELGLFQIFLFILLGLVGIPTGEQNLLMVFIGQDHDHWCTVPELGNLTLEQQKYIGVPYDYEKGKYDRCQQYDINFTQYSSEDLAGWNRTLMVDNTTAMKSCSAWTFDKTHGLSTINEAFGLVCDRDWLTSLATTIYMAGFMVGCIFYGSISDKYGRHITLIVTLFTEICFGLIAAFVPYYWLFVIFRFLAGTAAAGSFTTAFVMVMEAIGPKYRVILGVFMQGWFALGFMLVSGLGYAIRDHVMLQIVCATPTILLLSYWWLVPESPRWLISEGEMEKCYKLIKKMAKWNKTAAPEKHLLYSEKVRQSISERRQSTSERRRSVSDKAKGKETPSEDGETIVRKPNFFDLLRTPNMRKRSLNIFFNWFVNSLVYYGLSLSADSLGGSLYFNTFLSGAVELPAYVVLIFTMDRFGRKKSMIASMLIGGIACLACCPILDNESLRPLLVTFAMIGKFGISASFSIIYVYSAEVFPTVVRNVGVGSGSMNARIGGLVAPQIARLSRIWLPLPSIIFGFFSITAGLLFILLPETYGQVLPETLEDGENFGTKKYLAPGEDEEGESVGLNKMDRENTEQA